MQTLSVFIDTLLICTSTAFMCLLSGVEPAASLNGAPYVQKALSVALRGFGPVFITIAMVLFAFTTLVGNLFYVDQAWKHVFGKIPPRWFFLIYYAVAVLLIFVGAGLNAELLWGIADVLMGLLALINIPVIILLSRYALRALADYRQKKRRGAPLTFRASDIGLPQEVDYWGKTKRDKSKPKKHRK